MTEYTTDDRTLEGARQDLAVVINPEAPREQRLICIERMAHVDMATNFRLVTPLIETALGALEGELLEDVTMLMAQCFVDTMDDVFRAMDRKNG